MKVLVISATFPPMRSGGGDHAFRLCQYLAESGLDVRVLTSRIENVTTDSRITIYPLMRRWSWREMPRLLAIIKRINPDVINLHYSSPIYNHHPMVTFVPGIAKKICPKVRVVTQFEYPDGVPSGLPLLTRAGRTFAVHLVGWGDLSSAYGTILRDSDRIIALSEPHRELLTRGDTTLGEKCFVIPPPPIMPMCAESNGAVRQRARAALRVGDDEFLIAYYGYVYPGKGVETLLEALSLVLKRRRVRLVVVGGSNEVVLRELNRPQYPVELHELTEQLGIANQVSWTGYYPADSDRGSFYLRGADIGVLPFDDGVRISRSSLAAVAAHGLPIITTKGDTAESIFSHEENVLLCPPKEIGRAHV